MRKLKIDTLDKLEAFILNENISLENRFDIFALATKQYSVIILKITNGEGGKIENSNKTLAEMIRIIDDIRATPESFIAGFVVQYKKPSII